MKKFRLSFGKKQTDEFRETQVAEAALRIIFKDSSSEDQKNPRKDSQRLTINKETEIDLSQPFDFQIDHTLKLFSLRGGITYIELPQKFGNPTMLEFIKDNVNALKVYTATHVIYTVNFHKGCAFNGTPYHDCDIRAYRLTPHLKRKIYEFVKK